MTQRTESESSARSNPARSKPNADRKRQARKSLRRRLLKMENLEGRRLLNADTGGVVIPQVDPTAFELRTPRNIGTVTAFTIIEAEADRGVNDSLSTAVAVPLGTGPGQENTVDITGSVGITTGSQGNVSADIDNYAVNLRAGDILDLSVTGAVGNFTVFYGDGPRAGRIWFGADGNSALGAYPDGSPLMNVGNAVGAQVVPEDGRYVIQVVPNFTSGNYTLGMRAYRPVLESAPVGASQVIYLDFDGGTYFSSDFPSAGLPFGPVRILGLEESLELLGFTNPNVPEDVDVFIDFTLEEVNQQLRTLAQDGSLGSGTNGDFLTTGVPGDYGITVLNSRDHADPGRENPLVTRVIIGSESTTGFPPGGLFGIAQSIDVGNFRPNEIVLAGLEPHLATGASYPLSATASVAQAASQQLAGTITHEVGHSFGIFHTDGNNQVNNLMDEGSISLNDFSQGIGNDGIFGTSDDVVPYFNDDRFSLTENVFFGIERVPASLSHALSTGTIGGNISGRVFNDLNRDGNGQTDAGLPGVVVFADTDLDGVLDTFEPQATTNADGTYVLNIANGISVPIIAQIPAQFSATTGNQTLASSGASNINFGFYQVVPDVTGTKFADTNGNGVFDANESGIEGVYIYLDLDGDNRPDLGEPSGITNSDGQYTINFPGPGTYTIREVVQPGFQQTFPATGEHIVAFNGIALTDNFDFGNLPSRDYGDAPDSYQTSVAAGGPSHGLSNELGLGVNVDREVNGAPSANALGDDSTNIDDEDGVSLLSPLGPGGSATVQVVARNTNSVTSYLQGWIDFDANGTFDANEQVFTDLQLGAGTSTLNVDVPANAQTGSTFARFRYSPTPGLGPAGEADLGEVEDYQFDILAAAEIANDDNFTVSRNSLSNQLDVLANDFESALTTLTIVERNVSGTVGVVTIANDGRSIFYTPPNGFTGRDVFQYVVRDQLGNDFTATVVVNVNFQSNVPIAVDDVFEIPQGSSNRALNVLANDVPSIFGGLTITSVEAGSQGGQLQLEGGGQTIRYTPQAGFAGTEQFRYSVQDSNGSTSTAQVTVNSIPGALNDDLVEFTIGIFDVVNNQPISSVQVGDEFLVRVFVDELNNPNFSREGVASAFLDLLYTDQLVATRDTIAGDGFDFDVTFGPNFQGGGFKIGDAAIPGLINDVGAVQPIPGDGQLIGHTGPAELITITMTAVSPGIATFAADPADAAVAETILVDENVALTPAQQRLGRTELNILPAGQDFSSAIDDAFVNGTDSDGQVIRADQAPNRLDVLANDNFGPTGTIREFGIVTNASRGTLVLNQNNTPNDPNDDFIEYFADVNANGFDSFTYFIESTDGVRSTAEVTLAIGNAASDDIVDISFGLVDQLGNPITSVQSGSTFGVQVFVEDLRPAVDNTAVFAAYLDLLYDSQIITPGAGVAGGRYDFDVVFDSDFDTESGVGTAVRRGVIDEFGTLLEQSSAETPSSIVEPNLMATIFFVAGSVTTTTTTQVIGSPADASPFQDTLLIDRDDPVEVSQITYNSLSITVTPAGPQQNQALPEDVDNNGLVTPSDALTVINALAQSGEGESNGSTLYVDVTGDSIVSAIDALRVINYLSRQAAIGSLEGEQVSDTLSSDAAESVDDAIADVTEDLSVGAKLSGGSVVENQDAVSSDFLAVGTADDDDEASDILSLLADDQSNLG